MLLAEEFALATTQPEDGTSRTRHARPDERMPGRASHRRARARRHACARQFEGHARRTRAGRSRAGHTRRAVAGCGDRRRPPARGPKIKAVLSHMDRGLGKRLDTGTWDSVVDALGRHGAVALANGLHPRLTVSGEQLRHDVVERLRAAAAGDEPLRTAHGAAAFDDRPRPLVGGRIAGTRRTQTRPPADRPRPRRDGTGSRRQATSTSRPRGGCGGDRFVGDGHGRRGVVRLMRWVPRHPTARRGDAAHRGVRSGARRGMAHSGVRSPCRRHAGARRTCCCSVRGSDCGRHARSRRRLDTRR